MQRGQWIGDEHMLTVNVRIAVLGCLLVVAGMVRTGWSQTPPSNEVSGLAAAAAIESAMVQAIARAERSVVAIARVRNNVGTSVLGLEPRPDPFGGAARLPTPAQPTDPDFQAGDYLAGVVIDPRGLILTTYRGLGENYDYYVTTHDRRVYRAWIKGADPRSDLAVLQIDASNLAPIRFGNASTLRKGQIVIALGNPFAIARDGQACASWGIIANLGRKAPPLPSTEEPTGKPTLHHFGTLIQTDAKLSMGTDGGALINLKGEMVGLMTSLPAVAGFESAAGYAYPVDETFLRAVDRLKRGEEVEYGFLGVQPEDLSLDELVRGMHGIRVDRVVPGAPGDRAGLRPRDVILRVDGEPIYDKDGLVLAVGRLPVDKRVDLDVQREDRVVKVSARLTKYPVRGKAIVTVPPRRWRGIQVEYTTAMLDSEEIGLWGLPLDRDAVFVVDVERDSPAWKAGLRRGMLIESVDGRPVRTPKEFFALVRGKKGEVVLGLVDDGSRDFQPTRRVPAP